MNVESASVHFDILIIGAGLSGIGAAYHLQERFPGKTYAILEGRGAIGGTWDLFRYPGVRSDSDMYTLGYRFRPWLEQKAIADAPSILKYVRETATHYDIEKRIRFNHKLVRASWSSADSRWSLALDVTRDPEVARTRVPERVVLTCNIFYNCTGYYNYSGGFTPEFPGREEFRGEVVHPQNWPDALDYSGKRVVVVGSGATAITLVPAMAQQAAHVTMLQRSPTYVVSRPAEDGFALFVRKVLPEKPAYTVVRWKNVLVSIVTFGVARKYPQVIRNFISKGVKRELGEDFDVKTHFTPRYNPWDQRMCLAPDADIFDAIRNGKAEVVTDEIERFSSHGILLKSGRELKADIIVTATGLQLQLLSGVELVVDGKIMQMSERMAYKGMMLSDIPNFVSAFGYTNASWTLKCDLTAEYACRLIAYADRKGYRQFTPRRNDPSVKAEPVLAFNSGYVKRALHRLPSQGSKTPWRVHQNYVSDLLSLRYGRVNDGVMEFV